MNMASNILHLFWHTVSKIALLYPDIFRVASLTAGSISLLIFGKKKKNFLSTHCQCTHAYKHVWPHLHTHTRCLHTQLLMSCFLFLFLICMHIHTQTVRQTERERVIPHHWLLSWDITFISGIENKDCSYVHTLVQVSHVIYCDNSKNGSVGRHPLHFYKDDFFFCCLCWSQANRRASDQGALNFQLLRTFVYSGIFLLALYSII